MICMRMHTAQALWLLNSAQTAGRMHEAQHSAHLTVSSRLERRVVWGPHGSGGGELGVCEGACKRQRVSSVMKQPCAVSPRRELKLGCSPAPVRLAARQIQWYNVNRSLDW